jgi:hypothetical protein
MKRIKITALVLVMMLSSVFVGGCAGSKTTVDIEDFLTITVTGFDGSGRLSTSIQWNPLEAFIQNETGANEMTVSSFADTIEVSPDVSENLSNGDVVNLRISYNNTLAESLGVMFTGTAIRYTVEGLEKLELTSFSLKEAANIEIKGFNGLGSLNISFNNNHFKDNIPDISAKSLSDDEVYFFLEAEMNFAFTVNYNFEASENLKNGDAIEIEVLFDENRAKALGLSIIDVNFSVTVEGLEEAKTVKLSDLITVRLNRVNAMYHDMLISPTDDFPASVRFYALDNAVRFTCDEYPDIRYGSVNGNFRFAPNYKPAEGAIVTIRIVDSSLLGKAGYILESEYEQFVLE